jgi:hypothetical protein
MQTVWLMAWKSFVEDSLHVFSATSASYEKLDSDEVQDLELGRL